MLRCLAIFVLLGACRPTLIAREGYVRTRAGEIIDGQIRFESNSVVVVNLDRSLRRQIPFTNLLTLALQPVRETGWGTTASLGGNQLPAGWQGIDVGGAVREGGADWYSGGFRIWSFGTNLFGYDDSFHFIHRRAEGDRQVVGRVIRMPGGDAWSFAGFTIREGLGSTAKQVSIGLNSGKGIVFGWRQRSGGIAQVMVDDSARGSQWLKLSRKGQNFAAFRSGDGHRWHLVGRTTVSMSEEAQIGMAIAGREDGSVAESLMQHVDEGSWLRGSGSVPRIEMIGGSTQNGHVDSVDDSLVRIRGTGGMNLLATKAVAAIQFRPVPQRFLKLLAAGQPGVLLDDGQFVDGEIRDLRYGYVTISSVPLGLRHYDVHSEIVAVVLRPRGIPSRQPCRLLTTDGSVWQGADLRVEGNWVVIREPSFGVRRVPLYEVAELRWSS